MRAAGFVMAVLLLGGLAGATATPSAGDDTEPPTRGSARPQDHERSLLRFAQQPTGEHCLAAVAAARTLARTLPDGDVSRIFAESYLRQAMVEAGNREFDDCLEQVQNAKDEVQERRHVLRPGESLKILRADE
jgi:hypothetical protein